MRVEFTQDELGWLHALMLALMKFAAANKDDAILTTAAKMRHKFTPNATVVYLTQKQRSALMALTTYRAAKLEETGALTEEHAVIKSIIERIEGGHEAN